MSEPAKFAPEVVFAYDVLVSYAKEDKKTTYKDLYNVMAPAFGWPAWKPGHSWFKRLPLAKWVRSTGKTASLVFLPWCVNRTAPLGRVTRQRISKLPRQGANQSRLRM